VHFASLPNKYKEASSKDKEENKENSNRDVSNLSNNNAIDINNK